MERSNKGNNIQSVINRYHPSLNGKTNVGIEWELAVAPNPFVINTSALWNGGDGVEWVIHRELFKGKFQEKGVIHNYYYSTSCCDTD